jgi:Bacterial Ig-like domain
MIIMNRIIAASLIVPLALGAAACSDHPASPDNTTTAHEPPGIVISDAQLSSIAASATAASGSIAISSETSVAYVSVAPQTFPGAVTVEIRNRTTGGAARLVQVIDGGFDPVPIEARAGDVLELTISTASGATTLTVKVPARRPPAVVRSDPVKGRVDVALNVTVSVIFSEPIDPKTLSPTSLRLLQDGTPVTGSVRLSDNAWTAEFVPDEPLASQSSYELVVTQDIRDLDGDALERNYESDFSTVGCTILNVSVPTCSNEVSGLVTLRTPQGTQPLAQVSVGVSGYFTGPPGTETSFVRGAYTDVSGKYTVKGFPNGVFSISAADYASGTFGVLYDQPCAVEIELVAPTATADVELFSVDSPMPDAITSPPLLTGIVFEQTGNGRRPLAGVKIFLETFWGGAEVRTHTDENGRYALCRVPYGALYTQKPGYGLKNGDPDFVGLVDLAGLTEKQLDIEMKVSQ